MIKKVFLTTALVFCAAAAVMAFEVAGITVPDTYKENDTKLVLNGAGLRVVFGFQVYVGALYLKQKSTDAKSIINADEMMAIRLQWRRSAPPYKIKEVYYKSFAVSTGAKEAKVYGPEHDYGPLTKEINTYMSWVAQKKAAKGHYWNNVYVPGEGTKVYLFDGEKETLMGTIKGLDFKKVLFTIWLGEDNVRNVSSDLKEQMLGNN